MQFGLCGAGTMGGAVAKRLLEAGHDVVVWNRSPGRAVELIQAGAQPAGHPTEAAAGSRAVLLCLADDDAVRSVALGEDALAGALGGSTLVDTSTVSPETSRALAEAASGRFLAVPILGGPQAVLDGAATYLAAGPRTKLGELDALWGALSGHLRWVGEDPGRATTLKVIANYLLLTGLAALGEAVVAAQRLGLEDETIEQFLAGSPLMARALENRLLDVIGGQHDGWFDARLGAKDLRLATELAGGAGLSLPIGELARDRYELLAERGLADADIAAVVELLR